MTEKKDLIRKSKHLAILLRHDTEYQLDEHGWRNVNDLIKNHAYTMGELGDIVTNRLLISSRSRQRRKP